MARVDVVCRNEQVAMSLSPLNVYAILEPFHFAVRWPFGDWPSTIGPRDHCSWGLTVGGSGSVVDISREPPEAGRSFIHETVQAELSDAFPETLNSRHDFIWV